MMDHRVEEFGQQGEFHGMEEGFCNGFGLYCEIGVEVPQRRVG